MAPAACLMVGDTTVDIRMGRAAGAQTVGVLCGFGDERELSRAGADDILPETSGPGSALQPKRFHHPKFVESSSYSVRFLLRAGSLP